MVLQGEKFVAWEHCCREGNKKTPGLFPWHTSRGARSKPRQRGHAPILPRGHRASLSRGAFSLVWWLPGVA